MTNPIREGLKEAPMNVVDRFHSKALMSSLYDVLKHSYLPPSLFFIPCTLLASGKAREKMKEYLPSPLATFLEMHLTKLLALVPTTTFSTAKGFEVWTGITVNNSRSYGYLHVDNDEWLRTTKGKLRSPLMGSVLYVGPQKGMIGGSTMFIPILSSRTTLPIFTHHTDKALKEFEGAIEVKAIPGRLVTFPGKMPHAVLTAELAGSESPRITVLANLWEQRIASVSRGICAMTSIEYHGGY